MKHSTQTISSDKLMHDIDLTLEREEKPHTGAGKLRERSRRAQAGLGHAMQAVRAAGSRMKAETDAVARSAVRMAREHPYTTLGIALGIGYLIGWFLRRK